MVRGKTYWIGNIRGRSNGWCLRQHLHGIVIQVYADAPPEVSGQLYWYRPFPQPIFQRVTALIEQGRYNQAQDMCEAVPGTEVD